VKTAIRSKLLSLIALLLLLSLISCGVKTRVRLPQNQRMLPAQQASHADLFQALQEKSRQIQTLTGTVLLDLSKGDAKAGILDQYRQTKGYVVVDRPDHIKVQVPILLTTIAVMVSDGQQYRVLFPIQHQFAIRNIDEPISPKSSFSDLRPQIFLDGLFVDVNRFVDNTNVRPLFKEYVEGIHSYYIFGFVDVGNREAELLQEIWIDRTDLQVARKLIFGKDGRVETDVKYENYHASSGIPVPQVITIHRPAEDFTVKMTFQQTTLNQKLGDGIFDLPQPQGSQLLEATQ
jgi:outer membrane lipoprotein-sorting protein